MHRALCEEFGRYDDDSETTSEHGLAMVAWQRFVAAVPTAPTHDQRAAAAECGDVSGGRWGA